MLLSLVSFFYLTRTRYHVDNDNSDDGLIVVFLSSLARSPSLLLIYCNSQKSALNDGADDNDDENDDDAARARL